MDTTASVNFFVITFRAVIIAVKVIGIILVKQGIAAAASGVVVLIAVMAKGGVLVPVAIVCPDYRAASVTGSGVPLVAVGTHDFTIDFLVVFIFAY